MRLLRWIRLFFLFSFSTWLWLFFNYNVLLFNAVMTLRDIIQEWWILILVQKILRFSLLIISCFLLFIFEFLFIIKCSNRRHFAYLSNGRKLIEILVWKQIIVSQHLQLCFDRYFSLRGHLKVIEGLIIVQKTLLNWEGWLSALGSIFRFGNRAACQDIAILSFLLSCNRRLRGSHEVVILCSDLSFPFKSFFVFLIFWIIFSRNKWICTSSSSNCASSKFGLEGWNCRRSP